MLKLNQEKTDLTIFNPERMNRIIVEDIQFQVGEKTVCYYHARDIGSSRRYITRDACRTLTHALITSSLAYGSARLDILPGTLMTRLKKYRILQPD